jgi:nitroimidazol reductase NimA-like FMN-containing flavoprotein (pyridoxamine 5'-phosphate oxidase superfamily)
MSTESVLESTAQSMDDDQIKEFLTEQGVGVLTLPDEEIPYAVPMSFGYNGDSVLYFLFLLFGTESRKETLTDRAQGARFVVYSAQSMYDWQSVSLTGQISTVPEDEWDELQSAMQNAWHPDLFSSASPMRGVQGYQLQIQEWTGIRHSK